MFKQYKNKIILFLNSFKIILINKKYLVLRMNVKFGVAHG